VVTIAATAIFAPVLFSDAPPPSPPLALTLLSLLMMYPALAVTVKRTNDINWSPLWAYGLTACSVAMVIFDALGLLSAAGPLTYGLGAAFLVAIIVAIVIGCIRSADAKNAHGPSPLAVAA
jgi:uncharacterized membrane protein YhaH (DUF805 family)